LRGFLYRDESADKEEAMPSIGQENLETVMTPPLPSTGD
jgi:hypothetical protein